MFTHQLLESTQTRLTTKMNYESHESLNNTNGFQRLVQLLQWTQTYSTNVFLIVQDSESIEECSCCALSHSSRQKVPLPASQKVRSWPVSTGASEPPGRVAQHLKHTELAHFPRCQQLQLHSEACEHTITSRPSSFGFLL